MSLEQYFPPHEDNGLVWPDAKIFVAESNQLLFCPIAKCACSSLKRMMVELSDVPHKTEILSHDIHRATQKFRTGVLLRDRDIEDARRLMQAPEFFRFAVVRNPFDRLLSAYREKFLVKRLATRNHWVTGEVVGAVQGEERPDFDLGISFAEFVQYVTSQEPQTLNPHWRPQADYLRGMDYNRLFLFEELDVLSEDLARRTGKAVLIGHRNRSSVEHGRLVSGVSRQRAGTIKSPENINDLSYSEDRDLVAIIDDYFAEDHQLCARAIAESAP